MESNRLPRFKRALGSRDIRLTDRDHQIIRLVHRHRFLRSSHISSLITGSGQQILRRLQLLYHQGYLERPRQQLESYRQGGSQRMVYGLGDKAAEILESEFGIENRPQCWSKKHNSIKRVFLEHALLVSDTMVVLELACRKAGNIRLIHEDELAASRKNFKWHVKGNKGQKLSAFPDRVFALEQQRTEGAHDRAYFFLEADRGTMPVMRKNDSQTSFFRKLLAYEATWVQSLHRKRFGFHRFRVLTVTTSPERVQSLMEACSHLERGQGLFLFADKSILQNPESLLDSVWQTSKGRSASLLS